MLVISPHSDDESYGCAGTIAKVKDYGGQVYVMCISIGGLSQYRNGYKFIDSSKRKKEFINVMNLLKVDDYEIIYEDDEKHLRLDALSKRDLIAIIERDAKLSIQTIKPNIVCLPAISYNQDHEAIFKAGFTACRPSMSAIKHFPQIVLAYDNPTLFWNTEPDKFHPNFYVDISEYSDIKIKALKLHKSQQHPKEHHLSVNSLTHLMQMRGKEISVKAAEAYMCYRYVL